MVTISMLMYNIRKIYTQVYIHKIYTKYINTKIYNTKYKYKNM